MDSISDTVSGCVFCSINLERILGMMKTQDIGRYLLHGVNRRHDMTLARAGINSGWNMARRAVGKPAADAGLLEYAKVSGIRAISSLLGVKAAKPEQLPAGWPQDVFDIVARDIRVRGGTVKLPDGLTQPAFRLTTRGAVELPHMWIAFVEPTIEGMGSYDTVLGLGEDIEESLSHKGFNFGVRVQRRRLRIEIDKPKPAPIHMSDDWELLKAQPVNQFEYTFGTYFADGGLQIGIADLLDEREAHAIIAGMTGSGKSQLSLSILLSAAFNTSPAHLSMVIIDPKGVDFAGLAGLPHLANGKIINSLDDAAVAVRTVCAEMDKRMAAKDTKAMHNRIMLYIDEIPNLLDLDRAKGGDGESLEDMLIRMAQIGRGVGINVFLAAQQATKDVMSTRILKNMIWRMVGSVSSFDASVHLSGQSGCLAHKLPGRGSFLMYNPQFREGLRVQAHLVADPKLPDFAQRIAFFVGDIAERWAGIRPHWTLRLAEPEAETAYVQDSLLDDENMSIVQVGRPKAEWPTDFVVDVVKAKAQLGADFTAGTIQTLWKSKYKKTLNYNRALDLHAML
jgi:hypothetical protein